MLFNDRSTCLNSLCLNRVANALHTFLKRHPNSGFMVLIHLYLGEYPDNFQAQLHAEAKDWEVYRVRLDKSMDRPLGFSIIGKSEAGVIVKEIFPGTAAAL